MHAMNSIPATKAAISALRIEQRVERDVKAGIPEIDRRNHTESEESMRSYVVREIIGRVHENRQGELDKEPADRSEVDIRQLHQDQRPSWWNSFSWAFSRMEQVLTSRTSASSGSSVGSHVVAVAEQVAHTRGVILVHLAAVGLDIELFGLALAGFGGGVLLGYGHGLSHGYLVKNCSVGCGRRIIAG